MADAPPRPHPDRGHMLRAIELSRKAGLVDRTGRSFGAVIVDPAGRVVGEGTNQVWARRGP
jgi:tRNA(Arg) A34 adenosine deaminase TadA